MRNILARSNSRALRQFAQSRGVLAFDFDGTLAPIVDDPEAARMRPSTRRLLVEVAKSYPTAVISGRARADVLRRLDGLRLVGVVGNHGIEAGPMSSRDLRAVQRWASHLVDRTSGLLGVLVENKTHSLSVHYRHSRQKRSARTAIIEAIEGLGGVRVVPGKQVVNVLPAGAPHKGVALERLRKSAGCDTALYVGDDETDEDVFALDRPGHLLAIRVGRSMTSKAGHFIESQARIDDLLAELARLASLKGAAPRERRRA